MPVSSSYPYPPLLLERLVVHNLRNVARLDLRPSPRFTVLQGPNGHGKTSTLEAIYFAATSKSFRTTRTAELIRHGEKIASVRGFFRDGPSGVLREQTAAVEGGRRTVRIDGHRPPSFGHFAARSPVVCFHAEELTLSTGAASARRRLLDRVAMFLDPLSSDDRARYAIALRSRQRALKLRGPEGHDVEPFERLCARHGAALTQARQRAAAVLGDELVRAFAQIVPAVSLTATYVPGGGATEAENADEFRRRRTVDRVRAAASFGPQRDELRLILAGYDVRTVASQGQHRAVTLALKIAELRAVAHACARTPILLLDDLSSELDEARTASLWELLDETSGQVVVTTTRPELLPIPQGALSDRLDVIFWEGRGSADEREKPVNLPKFFGR